MRSMRRYKIAIALLVLVVDTHAQKYGFVRADTIAASLNSVVLENPWAGGFNAPQFSTIDLNMDGIDDLFVFDREGNKVLTFLNTGGTGTSYVYAPEYESKFPELQSWVLLRDFNNDGKKDIFTYYSGGIRLFQNTSISGSVSFQLKYNPFILSLQPPSTNLFNLYVSSVDIPAIDDIDGDGDLDVVTFDIFDPRVQYHRNYAIENTGSSDTMLFELRNKCWGHFKENQVSTNAVTLFDTCTNSSITNPEMLPYSGGENRNISFITEENLRGQRHAGSTLLTLDCNGDGVKDLILGDLGFNTMVQLTNDSKGVNMNTSFIAQDTAFPTNTIPVDIASFPAAFYEDLDNDGVKDFIVSPNSTFLAENKNNVWYYKNYGTDNNPQFILIQKDKLQDNMFDFGSAAKPAFVDYNGDGLMDIVVGNWGYFNKNNNSYESKLALLVNTGTLSQPAFNMVDEDFAGLSALALGDSYHPAFGDLDNDGDMDMVVGDKNGYLHYFTNTAGAGNPAVYALTQTKMRYNNNDSIDVGQNAAPVLFDMDGDGDLDLVVGNSIGRLYYVENKGNSTTPSWERISTNFGGVNVSEWWTTQGNASPAVFRNGTGEIQLFVGSESGYIHHFNDVEAHLQSGSFNVVDTMVAGINIGPRSTPTMADVNGNGKMEMVLGTMRGGLSFYVSDDNTVSGIRKNKSVTNYTVYPNPFSHEVTLELEQEGNYTYILYDLMGKRITSGSFNSKGMTIPLDYCAEGVYLLQVRSENAEIIVKLVKR